MYMQTIADNFIEFRGFLHQLKTSLKWLTVAMTLLETGEGSLKIIKITKQNIWGFSNHDLKGLIMVFVKRTKW